MRTMEREMVKINEALCDGCGLCIPNCHEGALQIIDGKVRLVSDLMCDGLGACLGHCPQGALEIELRQAEPYDEHKVMEKMVLKGKATVVAHLKHLKEHNETVYLQQGLNYIRTHAHTLPFHLVEVEQALDMQKQESRQWPIQMHLIQPTSAVFQEADLLVVADCVPFVMPNFHADYLPGKRIAIACPKLDQNQVVYLDKLRALIVDSKVKSITVMMMQVPCCSKLLKLVELAKEQSGVSIGVQVIVIGLDGKVISSTMLT